MQVPRIFLPRGCAYGNAQLGQFGSGVQARPILFGQSVDGLCRSRSFRCQADRQAARPGYAISVAVERLDDDRNFHGMPPYSQTIRISLILLR